MNILHNADLIRIKANSNLDLKTKPVLGQFFTEGPICLYMASLFNVIGGNITLLDPGCGSGILTAAFTEEALKRGKTISLDIDTLEVDGHLKPYAEETLSFAKKTALEFGLEIKSNFYEADFILDNPSKKYSHVIMNPPYKKIGANSEHRQALRKFNIEAVNLYSGFIALSIKNLQAGGELVAIVPRSFCNGAYYRDFRELLLRESAIEKIHIFDSRSSAFSGDEVLQENIIIHIVKGGIQGQVTITSSPFADFHIDEETKTITAKDKTIRMVDFNSIVNPNDEQQFIHIAANARDQRIIERLTIFNSSLNDLNLQVSTGPVVGFRLKSELLKEYAEGAAPLLYPVHLNKTVQWPSGSKKENAIAISDKTEKWLWTNKGNLILVNRFSSKDQRRRISAAFYDGSLPGDLIGIDNKLNVFHHNKGGFDKTLAFGLFIYLNSSLLDKLYRLFGGHTQVNATDLKIIKYPSIESLMRIGSEVKTLDINQKQIDELLDREIIKLTGNTENPLDAHYMLEKIQQILPALGMPKAQINERSALTLLALMNLQPGNSWQDIERPMIGVTPIMDWCRDIYGKEYAPNSRETFRRQTLHQFIDGGLCLYNPDDPGRAVNSPKACYQLTKELFDVLITFDTEEWEPSLQNWLALRKTLVEQYAKERDMEMIPLTLDDGTEIHLSPGNHSKLIHDIVTEFGPRFAPGSEVIYLGDTGAKEDYFKKERLAELGVEVDRKGKLPDAVLYWPEKDWLLLVESVTSHGPVDGKRHSELSKLFASASPGLVYVTAFPSRKIMTKYLTAISWETEVWTADAPTHMIHFNGDRFLGPHIPN